MTFLLEKMGLVYATHFIFFSKTLFTIFVANELSLLHSFRFFYSANESARERQNSFKTMTKCYLDFKYIYMHLSTYLPIYLYLYRYKSARLNVLAY